MPNSSPPRSTACGPIPRRPSSRNSQRAESDLSVNPISTCLTSLVTRGSARPASPAASSASAATSVNPLKPLACRRSSTAARSSPILALGGSSHAGSGMRSIFRLFRRSATMVALQTAIGEPSDRRACSVGQRLVLGRSGRTSVDEDRAGRVDDVDLGPAVETEVELARPHRSCGQLPVDVADVCAADDADVETARAEVLHELTDTLRIGVPVGHCRPVPVEDRCFEPAGERWRGRVSHVRILLCIAAHASRYLRSRCSSRHVRGHGAVPRAEP